MRRWPAAGILVLLVAGLITAAAMAGSSSSPARVALVTTTTTISSTTTTSTTTTTTSTSTTTTLPVARPAAAQYTSTLAGCPPPPQPSRPPPPPPWHPAVLVPESSLPAEQAPPPWTSDPTALDGKGMWVWLWQQTEGGNADRIVRRAAQAGLHQLWVRVADSQSGFYGAGELEAIVGPAHAAGIKVIAWGFPYLYDPVRDARWTADVFGWRSTGGDQVDGYSADIERSTEGVALTERRVAVYLQGVRNAAGNRLVVATVYPPLDQYWTGEYPYPTIARYVDAFAPMIYWECTDPAADAAQAIRRLGTLRSVHLIGQAFGMADVGGRAPAPSAAELDRFMDAGRQAGALGASFWVWQTATAEEWQAVASYRWTGA